ncbi:ATP:cob(I)alamin adenosyltransferase [Hyperthermus butylicus]|uniref:Universally conserved protein n=1 Tax=Hyperthermus butylicus (strain DSM 5456 / JCM 9403 / PLM1-5) TaxID=415426 RepID=A2BLG8_HYPBU|nr:ATP:cob(I)alamin adenosyltransferase [Hyperthermus butylicus]ABM80829.1 universally conserved protein [Hyperthermus butylicus DSM 5456]
MVVPVEQRLGLKLSTGLGDSGYTFVPCAGWVPKSHPCVEFVGTLDEAEAAIGLAMSILEWLDKRNRHIAIILKKVQQLLFRIGFTINGRTCLGPEDLKWVESLVEKLSQNLEPTFKLNGGHPAAAAVSLARAVTRRAERAFWRCVWEVGLPQGQVELPARLLNRLSDLLYLLQHEINKNHGMEIDEVTC